jgi:SAM-dependent methyltransferase
MTKGNPGVTRGVGLLERFLAKKRSGKANSLIPETARQGRILDIGCGTFPYFLVNTDFKEKYGIDQSAAVNEYHGLPAGDPGLRLKQWNFGHENALPFETGFFDVVTMLAVFEHIEVDHIRGLVSEIRRTLKPGGMFILTTPAGWTDRLLRFMAKLRLVSAVEIEDHKDTYNFHKIASILLDGGFEKEKIRLGYFEFFMNLWGEALK